MSDTLSKFRNQSAGKLLCNRFTVGSVLEGDFAVESRTLNHYPAGVDLHAISTSSTERAV